MGDWELIAKWCEFYSKTLLVQTKSLMKRMTPILDAYGLFLPSRMGVTLSQDLLQKGLSKKSTSAAASSTATANDDVGDEEFQLEEDNKVCKEDGSSEAAMQDEDERREAD